MNTPKRRSPIENRARLLEIASTQAGFFSARQALAAGYARPNFVQHQRTGEWELVLRGIYRLTAWPFDRTEQLVLWSLWSGGAGVVSHESAAEFFEIGVLQGHAVHLTVPPDIRRQLPAQSPVGPLPVLHRGIVPEADRWHQRGFVVTSPTRTIVDLAEAGIDADHLARTIEDGLRRELFDRSSLQQHARAHPGRGADRVMEALQTLNVATGDIGLD